MSVMSELSMQQTEDREMTLFDTPETAPAVQPIPTTPTAQPIPAAPEPPATPAPAEKTEEEKKREHEEAEAKRKAEWEAKKKAREDEIQLQWENAVNMPQDQLIDSSVKRLGDMTEWLTRRNMKLCVTEHLQMLCYENPDLACKVFHPRKSMMNCFKYINRKALEYLKQFQEESGEKPIDGIIGGDVPDDLCYQWAVEYFNDMNAEEDKTKDDEEFVPRAYRSTTPTRTKKKETKKKETPKKVEPAPKPADTVNQMQLTFETAQQSFLEGVA